MGNNPEPNPGALPVIPRVDAAIDRGIEFLFNHQYPNGEFCCYFSNEEAMQHWCVPESTVFNTIVTGLCLLPLSGDPRVDAMLARVEEFLLLQMHPSGAWNFYFDRNPMFRAMPFDTDSIALASLFLRERGHDLQYLNRPVLLANRNGKGLFYTFIVWRARWPGSMRNVRLMSHALRYPVAGLRFWFATEAGRSDVDMGINANIAAYLGDIPETAPIARELCNVFRAGQEGECDKWYLNPLTIDYLASRACRQGVPGLEEVRDLAVPRIHAAIRDGGKGPRKALESALAMVSLANFGCTGEPFDEAALTLLDMQEGQGEWPRWAYYFGGPDRLTTFGSEELTTAFALEALTLYRGLRG